MPVSMTIEEYILYVKTRTAKWTEEIFNKFMSGERKGNIPVWKDTCVHGFDYDCDDNYKPIRLWYVDAPPAKECQDEHEFEDYLAYTMEDNDFNSHYENKIKRFNPNKPIVRPMSNEEIDMLFKKYMRKDKNSLSDMPSAILMLVPPKKKIKKNGNDIEKNMDSAHR